MRTIVISDLHLGAASGKDLARRAELRAPLLAALHDADRLVVLGDGLELREAPHRDAAELAGPFFADAGRALGPEGEILMLAGNHDHGLVAGWIDTRLQSEPSGFLGLSEPVEPGRRRPAGGPARRARRARPAADRLPGRVAPRRRLRDPRPLPRPALDDADVRAARRRGDGPLGRAAARDGGAARRLRGGARAPLRVPAPAHAALRPRRGQRRRGRLGARVGRDGGGGPGAPSAARGDARHRLRRRRRGDQPARARARRPRPLRRRAAPRRAARHPRGAHAGSASTAPHVVFGHTHRSGPWPRDDPGEWRTPAGSRLHNTGSWVYQPHFLSAEPNASPYWPGTAVVLEDGAPPRLIRMLGERSHPELRPRG